MGGVHPAQKGSAGTVRDPRGRAKGLSTAGMGLGWNRYCDVLAGAGGNSVTDRLHCSKRRGGGGSSKWATGLLELRTCMAMTHHDRVRGGSTRLYRRPAWKVGQGRVRCRGWLALFCAVEPVALGGWVPCARQSTPPVRSGPEPPTGCCQGTRYGPKWPQWARGSK